jgi:gas vesicle protein
LDQRAPSRGQLRFVGLMKTLSRTGNELMDIKTTILRGERFTAPNSLDPHVQSAADVPIVAQADEAGATHPTEGLPKVATVTHDAPPVGESSGGQIYGGMTGPDPDLTVSRPKQVVTWVTSAARKGSAQLVRSIRQDPYRAALVGVTLVSVVLQWRTRKNVPIESSSVAAKGVQSPWGPVVGSIMSRLRPPIATSESHIDGMAQRLVGEAGTKAQYVSQQAQQLGSQARDRAEDLRGQIQGTVRDLGDEARDHVNDARNNAQDQLKRVGGDVQETYQRIKEIGKVS